MNTNNVPKNAIPANPKMHHIQRRRDGGFEGAFKTFDQAYEVKHRLDVFVDIVEKPVFTQYPGYSLTGE